MCPVSSLTIGGGASQHVIPGSLWDQTLTLLASSPEITRSMEDHCMRSLTMIRESARGTPRMISGVSNLALTTLTGSNPHSNTSGICPSPLRLRATAKPLASSSSTRKKYAKSKNDFGKPANSKMLVDVGLRVPMRYIGLKRRLWTWIVGRGYVTGIQGVRNVGIPPEKGVMSWNDV